MSANNRRRGFNFERELVNAAKELGLKAKRAWGSNGQALGEHEEVDVVIEGHKFQCKRRKKLPNYLDVRTRVDQLAIQPLADGSFMGLLPFEVWLDHIQDTTDGDESSLVQHCVSVLDLREKLPADLTPSEHVDGVITRADRGRALLIMRVRDG